MAHNRSEFIISAYLLPEPRGRLQKLYFPIQIKLAIGLDCREIDEVQPHENNPTVKVIHSLSPACQ